MFRIQLFLIILLDYHTILALFVVTAPKVIYTARYGHTVQMICHFPIPKQGDLNKLKVSWQHYPPKLSNPRQVTMFNNGREDVSSQENFYKRRASLLIQELKNGMAILQIEEVKLTDAGTYVCALELGGSDYQELRLIVQASYSNITTSSNTSKDNEISLTCESLGFPEAQVYWEQNGVNASFQVNNSCTQTTDGFHKITSTIKGVHMNQSYNCVFWNQALSEKTKAVLKYSVSDPSTQPFLIITIVGSMIFFVGMAVIFYYKRHWCFKCFRKKGDRSSTL
ncbi:programmed cell death 1 ligand 1-like [Hyla sarda]|uniref:programmed cell death 1 ligand 1-like n=1 Tax=Hyla sarda TaxID=327740 RepID=UPI0024C3B18C|nr:programmed cell death 1 ligand 1-like [Hyla sarda]